ncbi:MAG: class I SAM-dependent methyltransferase [Alphaproteobacteria bacterium]|nr:class I SAM-dependent methyltransferase [Alphaproteobacteria bacterium]MBQ7660036.1 class I SAM-dependent methyltransferase [Alphaproteobacteria bacterium]
MATQKASITKNAKAVKKPAYLDSFYSIFYRKSKLSMLLNDDRVQSFLSLGFRSRLIDELLEDIGTNSSVLQIGCTFGSQIKKTAEKIGKYGSYTVMDVLENQLAFCKEQNKNQNINFVLYDARKPFDLKFDAVVCFMLLHELPPTSRRKVVNNALDSVKKDGKVIFIDYDKPSKLNPLYFMLKPFNRLFFPLTESLQTTPIQALAQKSAHFAWYKKNYAGKMFQKVVAVRRIADEKKPEVKPSFY